MRVSEKLAHRADRAADSLLTQAEWDPFRFIDLIAAAARGKSSQQFCREIQRLEWELLFDCCFRQRPSKLLDGFLSRRFLRPGYNAIQAFAFFAGF